MRDIDKLLSARTSQKKPSQKMQEMAQRSSSGNLTSFAGVFTMAELSSQQKESIEQLLQGHATDEAVDYAADFQQLVLITGEIKAIDNQALLLHGERIARAQKILTKYREGAFTAWLIVAYGNRQTPYNFLHYYSFHEAIAKELKPYLARMPRQAIYTLASREGELAKKEALVKSYAGEGKEALLETIRLAFPLASHDKRSRNVFSQLRKALLKVSADIETHATALHHADKEWLLEHLEAMRQKLI